MKFFERLFHNKSIVTLISLVACIIILFIAYRYRVNSAINAVSVPIASRDLASREEITEDSFTTVKVAQSMLTSNVILNKNDLIGKYVNYNTFIPEGGMFFKSSVVTWDQMPDSAWSGIGEGYTVFSLSVDSSSTYGNSIYPKDKIDLFYQNTINGKIFIGPLVSGIEVLAVKDSSGRHIFKKSAEQSNARQLIFAVSDKDENTNNEDNESLFALLEKASYISGGKIIVIPRNADYNAVNTSIGNKEVIKFITDNSNDYIQDTVDNVKVDNEIKVTE